MNWAGWGRSKRVAPWWVLAGAACASAPAVAPKTNVRLEPTITVSQPAAPLPNLPPITGGGSIADPQGPKVRNLNLVDQDLTAVVRILADQYGLQYQVDPSVHARVNTTLRNKTLTEALDAIMPQGVSYGIRNGVLRVGPARLETRTFSLDYVALSRVGTASTVIQRRLGNGALAGSNGIGASTGGLSGGNGAGADFITGVSIADVWEDVRISVEALTFDVGAGASAAASAPAPSSGSASMSGGRSYSRTTPDGRRLIVNPIAGQITVTAMPSRLDQIEFFIKGFEASIQRQVLIEAKIVEVNLDRSSEFGIDWNVVASNPAANLQRTTLSQGNLSSGAGRLGSNIGFTLNGGGARITAVLTALSSQGDVHVLSSPRVSALNNQRAVFDVTTGEIVFNSSRQPVVGPNGTTTFIETVTPTQVNVGIVLDVLAQISADNTVTMNIRPVVTSVARTASFTSADGAVFQAPVIDTRESDTMARLRGGETIIIGGLMQNRREKVTSGVPILRSIPLIGRLFTRTVEIDRKAELVIFLTPTIIAGPPPAGR